MRIRTRFDQLSKTTGSALRSRLSGLVETDAEASAEPRRIDLYSEPGRDPRPTPQLPRPARPHHRRAQHARVLPQHAQRRRARRLRRQARPVPPSPRPPQASRRRSRPYGSSPRGVPTAVSRAYAFAAPEAGPPGIYDAPALLWTRLVVISELPVVRNTLLLRLLGAGRVLTQAIAQLKALPADAPERRLRSRFCYACAWTFPPIPTTRHPKTRSF